MKVYRRRQQNVGKWILAGLAFVLVMTLTFADVYGVGVPGKPGDQREPNGPVTPRTDDVRTQNTPDPAPVPEPATMILMAVGLGAAALMRTKKKA